MVRLVLSILLLVALVGPVTAQVINGETPLDETPIHRETSGPADRTSDPPSPFGEPDRRDVPQTAPRRD